MKRRAFIAGLGAAAAWPLAARAQQKAPVIGHLAAGAENAGQASLAAFGKGLGEQGYIAGRNVEILSRWAGAQPDRLPDMAADLVRRGVAIIFAEPSNATALTAKAATPIIPIVFVVGADPVQLGLVASLARPGGNLTGVTFLNEDLTAKRLGLLHEIVPAAMTIGYLVNPDTPQVEVRASEAEAAARTLGVRLLVLSANTPSAIESVFAGLASQQISAVLVGSDLLFAVQRDQLVALAAEHAVAAIYGDSSAVEAGGLVSYAAADGLDLYRIAGTYAGRILKGERAADLPVQRSTRIAIAVNLRTAKALGINMPTSMLLRADTVIE